jgi:hypothetical protein
LISISLIKDFHRYCDKLLKFMCLIIISIHVAYLSFLSSPYLFAIFRHDHKSEEERKTIEVM